MDKPKPDDLCLMREVHFRGGISARDDQEDVLRARVPGFGAFFQFERPEYRQLYQTLKEIGLDPIGVEFFKNPEELKGLRPSDWTGRCWLTGNWVAKFRADAWANAKYGLAKEKLFEEALIAGKIAEYLRLLDFRLLEISQGYQKALCVHLYAAKERDQEWSGFANNAWLFHVNAAIHSFFADAGSCIDLLAEAFWSFKAYDQPETRKMKWLKKLQLNRDGTFFGYSMRHSGEKLDQISRRCEEHDNP